MYMEPEIGQLYHLKKEACNFARFRLTAGPLKGIYPRGLYFIHDYDPMLIKNTAYVIVLESNINNIVLRRVGKHRPGEFKFFEPVNVDWYIYKYLPDLDLRIKKDPQGEVNLYSYDLYNRDSREFLLDFQKDIFEMQFEPYELMQKGNENQDIDILVNGF